MEIVDNCWSDISADHCVYGDYHFDGGMAKIYVYGGLSVWSKPIREKFSTHDQYGEGNCLLVFDGVNKFNITITPYATSESGEVIWKDPVRHMLANIETSLARKFFLDGSCHEGNASFWAEIEAQKFSLHILD